MRTYIIGYGSLLKRASLNRTLPTVEEIQPIYLKNYKRSWNANENITPTLSTTYLGIQKSNNSKMNAIIFEIDNDFLSVLDKREFLYDRVEVNIEDIELITSKFNITKKDKIWIYLTKSPDKPSSNNPIIQSYVDTCLAGAFEIENEFNIESFAKDFIETTYNWSEHWVNDRIYPRAPHIYQPEAYLIDKLLNELLHDEFIKIRVE